MPHQRCRLPTANNHLTILADFLLSANRRNPSNQDKELREVLPLSQSDLIDLVELASKHHVIVRSFEALSAFISCQGDDQPVGVAQRMDLERARISHALSFLQRICDACESEKCHVVAIKSLDHWPDLGSDLDLYTDAHPTDVIRIMRRHFNSRLAGRSWGDRLANKWNFILPGLPELVEFHIGRLGQTGEQIKFARHLNERAILAQVGEHCFRVPAAEDRVIISTLQRMYRHFYFRLCDIVDTARLADAHAIDFEQLRASAAAAGVWEGTATYLSIVSDYVKAFRGEGLGIPSFVKSAARFGGDQVSFRRGFLRVPILPHSLELFAYELRKLAGSGDMRGTARLSLFPGLAVAAAIGHKLTGSDKGIW